MDDLPILKNSSAKYILGSDEVGAGALAGPMVVCAVLAPKGWLPPKGLRDSKKMTEAQRELIYEQHRHDPTLTVVLKEVSPAYIDQVGKQRSLIEAHEQAIQEALKGVNQEEVLIVSDGNMQIAGSISIPKADDLVSAVSMASVIAKVYRDRIMWDYSREYPGYGFDLHSGYGVKVHMDALTRLGPCKIHRYSFSPVKKAADKKESRDAIGLLSLVMDD